MAITQRATVDDVARLAGVSRKTASRVFNQPHLVNPATAAHVFAAATRLKYRPNALAQNLRSGEGSRTVGLIIGELANPFYAKVASGVEHELADNGLSLLVASTDDSAAAERRVADALLSQRIAALLMIPTSDDQAYLEGERALGTPIVTIDRPARNVLADAVVLDNRSGVAEAIQNLVAVGHRRIGYVCNPTSVFTQRERLTAYREVMTAAGIPSTARWERCLDDRDIPAERIVGDLLDDRDGPTALVCGNNRMTIGALRALRERDDDTTALIGIDDFDTADVLNVSVVTYDPVALGRLAARVALERMADPAAFPRMHTAPMHVIQRGTGERPPMR